MKNNRTFLEKLLDGAKVEWKPLKKVCNFISTGKLNANAMDENGIYPFFTCNEKPYKINNYAFDMEAILISGNGSQVGHLNYFKGKFNAYQRTYVIGEFDNNTLAMYLYHYLNFKLRDYITINSKKGSVPYITLPMLEKFEIPIPPLPVQTEIVKILDALTALTSELTSELTLRRKQYEYYREKLLSEEELIKLGATTENLGDITSITSGGTPSTKEPAYWVEGNIPWIKSESCKNKLIDEIKHHITEMGLQNSNAKLLSPNTTLMAMVGATIFKTAFLPFEATTNQNIAAIKSKNELSITDKFIFYYLTNMYDFFISKLSGYNMVNLSQIKNIKILLPPLEEQQRIVSILDKFEALTNSITEGLPLAIEQSQKRYEYYRELLLNFS